MDAKSAMDLVKEAKQQIENLTPEQVQEELLSGNVVLIDIREGGELEQNGRISGSVHAPRGMLPQKPCNCSWSSPTGTSNRSLKN